MFEYNHLQTRVCEGMTTVLLLLWLLLWLLLLLLLLWLSRMLWSCVLHIYRSD